MIGVIVPHRLRADWQQEWEAELRNRERLLVEWDNLNWQTKLDLLRRSLGAFWDALLLQPRRWEDEMFQDLRFGVRMLFKHKGFTAIAVFTLALGIGANTAIFSIVDAVLLRPLPYRDAERLVKVLETSAQRKSDRMMVSLADFYEWKNQNQSFDGMAALAHSSFRVTGQAAPEEVSGNRVSANFFSLLGAQVSAGRAFLPEDENPDAEPVVVLSHQYWASRFGSSADVIGRTITLNEKSHVVVGVLPPDFHETFESIPGRARIWVPARFPEEAAAQRGPGGYMALARLKHGTSLAQAREEMNTIAERLARAYPKSNRDVGAAVYLLHEEVTGSTRQTLLTLFAAFGFVLLIACANVASLLLARGMERAKEIAIRAAIGAGRLRIVRQLLTECALLGLLGGTFAFLLAKWILAAVLPLIPRNVPRTGEIALDYRAMLFSLATALLASLLCGLLPALQTFKLNLTETLKDSGQPASAGRQTRWWRGSLIVWQMALTTVLLIGAGLLTNSLIRLYRTDPGFNTQNLLTVNLRLPRTKDESPHQWNNFWNPLAEQARNLPGIEGAALVSPLPLGDSTFATKVEFPKSAAILSSEDTAIGYNTVSHEYFGLLGIRLLRGRYFNAADTAESQPAVVVNENLARTYFPGQEAVGQILSVNRGMKTEKAAIIIGIVADSRARLDKPVQPGLYLSLTQFPQPSMFLVARTATDPTGFTGALGSLASSLNKNLPLGQFTSMTEIWNGYTIRPRFYLSVLGCLAALAVLLAATGIYGALSHTVGQRTHEIGIRRALGAQDGDVLRLVIRQGMILSVLGIILGLGGALMMTRLMQEWLYQVSATDPATIFIVTVLLALIALAACYTPARRATKVDPLVALRHE